MLALPNTDPDRTALLEEFRAAYDELAKTDAELPAFDDVVAKLPRALRNTTAIEFNTNGRVKTPDISWRDAPGLDTGWWAGSGSRFHGRTADRHLHAPRDRGG